MDSPKRDASTTEGTMSIVELNNLVISFRMSVRYARIVVVKKLAKQINTYKTKKGTEEQLQTNLRKAERLQQQIAVLKKCKEDKITKFCLASKFNLEEVAQKGTTEEKALTRVACQKLIRTKVCDWRKTHPDWQLLCEKLKTWVSKRVRNKDMAILKTEILFKKKEETKLEESVDERTEGNSDDESLESDSRVETDGSYVQEEKEDKRKTRGRVAAVKSQMKDRQQGASGSDDDDDDEVCEQKIRKSNSSANASFLNKKKQKSESSDIKTTSDKFRYSSKSEKCKPEKSSRNKDSAPVKMQNASTHPSWEAKKKEKEQNFITFQHKSVIFSD